VAVVVACDSPIGRMAEAVDQAARHLPPPDRPYFCPCCSTEAWPCDGFDDAARSLLAAGLRLAEFVPHELHQRLWPQRQRRYPDEQ
jgi:hypothetical protein